MRLTYHNLVIELPMDGIKAIESIEISQKLNEHGRAGIKAMVEEERALELVEQTDSGLSVVISRMDGQALFCGRGNRISAMKEGGLYYLHIEFYGYTRDWDLTEKSQSFCKGNDTYEQVLRKVLSEYPEKEIRDEVTEGKKIPEMLLQYEETDWEFLKRLASHFSTFLLADDTGEKGKVYFGVPRMDKGTVLKDEEYTALRGKERYDGMEGTQDLLSQEMTGWRVRTRKQLCFGEQVMLDHIETVVTETNIHTEQGELVWEYELSRRRGILCDKKKNSRIYGMSIPATVKERKGNQIRVHFDIDPVYEASDDLKYFTYAIETSNFYCMPEEESRVHIYFPSHDEQDAMAVHALSAGSVPGGPAGGFPQNTGGSSVAPAVSADVNHSGHRASTQGGNGGYSDNGMEESYSGNTVGESSGSGMSFAGGTGTGAVPAAVPAVVPVAEEKKQQPKEPPIKTFSDPSGSFLQLGPDGVVMATKTTALMMDPAGTLIINCSRLTLSTDYTLHIGGKEGAIPEIAAIAKADMTATLTGEESSIKFGKDTDIMSAFIRKDAELKTNVFPLADMVAGSLKMGDADLRQNYNADATNYLAALAQKRIEGEQKKRSGAIGALTVIGIIGLTALTGGLTGPVLLIGAAVLCDDLSEYAEGKSDIEKANEGDLSQSFNFSREILYLGDETAYQVGSELMEILFYVVSGQAIKGNIKMFSETNKLAGLLSKTQTLCEQSKKANYAFNIVGDVVTSAVNDYVDTGEITLNNLASGFFSGTMKGFGSTAIQSIPLLKNIDNDFLRKSANTIAGTGVGMGVDYVRSWLRDEVYNPLQSLVQNFFQSGLAQYFGEPIDAASGAFIMTAHVFILPDILTPIYLTRQYLSTNTKAGWLGKGWKLSYEGRLCYDTDKGVIHAQLPDGYCAAYEQTGEDTEEYHDIAGSGKYVLSHDRAAGLWNIMDTHSFRTYCYNMAGLLISVVDKNGCSLVIEYSGEYPWRMTTPLGYEVRFTFHGDRLTGMEDGMGRRVQYRYEKDLLTEVVHMDGGISRYAYTEEGFLSQPTDQTGLAYLTNEYDAKGRVILQTLANGDTYRAQYDDRKREVSMEYSGYPGKRVYTYNEKMAVMKVVYPDGTQETFAYDARNNRIMETGRTGGVTRREYDGSGHLIRESLPGGLEKEYTYNAGGDLISIRDSGGRQTEMSYDSLHNLTLRRVKTAEGQWTEEKFTWDTLGRLTAQEDGEGNLTRYCYGEGSAYPYRTIHADGSELLCGYDGLGRKLWEEDGTGRTEYAYNRNGWQTMERDGEGNETHRLYDGAGRLTALYSPAQWAAGDGKRTQYAYDFMDRLTETIHSDGSHEKQFRDGEGNIVKKVHPNAYDARTGDGEGTCYDYDGENRLLRIRYPDGGVERFFHDGAGNRTKHVLPEQYEEGTDDGNGWTYTYDEAGRLLSTAGPDGTVEETNEYDLWGKCVQRTDAEGYRSHYTYDFQGRMVRELVPAGQDQDDLHYRMTEYAYDNNGNRIRVTRYGGRYTEDGAMAEAGTDLTLTFTYDARNRLTMVEDGMGAQVTYRYDARGNRTGEEMVVRRGDNAEGKGAGNKGSRSKERSVLKKVRYLYDRAGRLTEKREILDSGLGEDAGKGAVMAATRYTYDANGNRTGIVTPEGYHITREYDCRDRLIMERMEDRENGIDLKTFFTYDRAGNAASVRQEGKDGQTREITYSRDLKDRLTRVEELDGPVVMASYDKNDRMTGRKMLLPSGDERYAETLSGYDVHGNLTESRKNGQITERNGYDRKNRIIRNTDGDGIEVRCRYGIQDEQRQILTAGSRKQDKAAQTITYNARGMVTGTEDGCGNRTAYTLDGWGRITAVKTAEGGREEYAYDCAGNVTESTDANGNIIHYAYNSMGKVCAITDQSGNTETFRYDREGRQTEHTDRNGTVTEIRYNIYGKPTMQTCTDKNGNRQVMGTWEYDSFGQLKKAVAGGFCYTYEYRPDGKLLNKWSSGKKVESCTYYRDGSLKSMTDVSGKTVYYEYDGNGRLKCLKEDTDTILTEYRYTAAGRIREIITKNGVKTSYIYDEDGNISRLTIGDGTEEGLLYDAFMLYDLNGNRTGKTGSRLDIGGEQAEMAVSYRYDSMNRLTNEDRNGTGERYAYDLCGNRLIREQYHSGYVDVTEGYRYNERNELTERIKSGSLTAYCYDKNGSIVSEAEEGRKSEYRYDLLSRQIYVRTLDGKEQENFYDGEGLRAGLKENGKSMTFLFHNGEILTECDGDSAPVRRHVRGIGLSHVQTVHDNVYHAYHQDEQGSTAYITGQGRETENIYQYDAFGNLTEKKEGITNRILYTGQQYDQETGQYYLRARYYNPVVGRFMQEDTYRGGGLNLYAYCANNPVVYYDPSGHDPEYGDTGEKVPGGVPGGQAGNARIVDDVLDDELLKNANSVKDNLPTWAQNKGNFGYSEVDIEGLDNTQFFAHSSIQTEIPSVKDSGISVKPESSPFRTVEVNDKNMINGEGAWSRDVDTEYKILSDIQNKLGDNYSASGKIKLYTELEPCPSCQSVINQFKEMYSNIDIEVIYSVKK